MPALTLENMDASLSIIENAGLKYLRQEINWSEVETSQDVYNWSAVEPLDLLFSSAKSRDLQTVAVLTGGPVYLAAQGQPVDQKILGARWEKFVQAAVDHFGNVIDIWEIGSAVNASTGLSPFLYPLSPNDPITPDPVLYSKFLRAASKIIKDSDPNDQVWMGSLVSMMAGNCAMSPLTFLLEVNGAKGWKSADAVLYQPRRGALPPEISSNASPNPACNSNLSAVPASMSAEVQSIQELVRQLGGKPVHITALGWTPAQLSEISSGRALSAEQLESDLLVRASSALLGQNTLTTIFWQVDLVHNVEAQNSLANLDQLLANTKPLGQVQGQSGSVQEYRFRKAGTTIISAWRTQDGDTPYPVLLDGSGMKTFTAYPAGAAGLTRETGITIPVSDSGEMTVLLNERPVLFSGKSSDLAENMKQSMNDQIEMWKLDLNRVMVRGLNDMKASLKDLAEEWFNKAKESVVQWGEDKLDEILP